jgi:hypothetical protein
MRVKSPLIRMAAHVPGLWPPPEQHRRHDRRDYRSTESDGEVAECVGVAASSSSESWMKVRANAPAPAASGRHRFRSPEAHPPRS